jgi:hypothetical protein
MSSEPWDIVLSLLKPSFPLFQPLQHEGTKVSRRNGFVDQRGDPVTLRIKGDDFVVLPGPS